MERRDVPRGKCADSAVPRRTPHPARFLLPAGWETNMVVAWDNRLCLHQAYNDYQGHRREIHATVSGEKPALSSSATMPSMTSRGSSVATSSWHRTLRIYDPHMRDYNVESRPGARPSSRLTFPETPSRCRRFCASATRRIGMQPAGGEPDCRATTCRSDLSLHRVSRA